MSNNTSLIFMNGDPVGEGNFEEDDSDYSSYSEDLGFLGVRSKRTRTISTPGQEPFADYQGLVPTCTRYALSKATCRGFQRKYFFPAAEVDFKQNYITSVLNK